MLKYLGGDVPSTNDCIVGCGGYIPMVDGYLLLFLLLFLFAKLIVSSSPIATCLTCVHELLQLRLRFVFCWVVVCWFFSLEQLVIASLAFRPSLTGV